MQFDFNTNINESSISNQAYKKMVDYYTRTKQYKKLQDFIAKYNSIQQSYPIQDKPNNSIDSNNSNVEEPIQHIEPQQIEQKEQGISNSKFAKIIKNVGNDNLAFKNALIEIADAHSKILDLYEDTLYEDTWTETTINQFEDLIHDPYIRIKTILFNLKSI